MEFFVTAFLFILGLCIGSFLNVLVWRLSDEKAPKFWQGRSVCPKCKHQLSWQDNIPLFSFIALSGRCRYCRKSISWQYPVVEVLTGVATVLIGSQLSHLGYLSVLSYLLIIYAFIVIFFADLEFQIIPDEMIVIIILATLGLNYQIPFFVSLGQNLLVGLGAFLAFWAIYLATKGRGIGFGDVKLAFAMGLLLGFPAILVGVWFAFILGGAFAVVLLILHHKKFRDTMALGPFLVLGTLIAALWSTEILHGVGL